MPKSRSSYMYLSRNTDLSAKSFFKYSSQSSWPSGHIEDLLSYGPSIGLFFPGKLPAAHISVFQAPVQNISFSTRHLWL